MSLNRNKKIYFITVYGFQENEKIEKVDKFYKDLQEIYETYKEEGDIYIIGDFNAKIEINNIEKNIYQKESKNGKKLNNMIIYNNLGCNNIVMPTTTWWTRESRTDNTANQKSIVDYILWKKNNMTEIENLEIDEDLTHTLRGGKKLKGKFTDHNAFIFEINNCDTNIEVDKGKIKIISRDFNSVDLNKWMNRWNYNENYNEEENYEEWVKHANTFIKDYTKEIWVNKATKNKENSKIISLRKTKKEIEKRIKKNQGNKKELIKKKREINKEILECTKSKVIRDINKQATRIEKASTNSKIFYKTLKKIKNKDREDLENYVIDFEGNKKEGNEEVHVFKKFFTVIYMK